MTRKEAIENHRKMWNWIADETERQQRIVTKADYFRSIELKPNWSEVYLYCCIGAAWRTIRNGLTNIIGKKAAECAREIANLPEREDVQNERVGIPEDSES